MKNLKDVELYLMDLDGTVYIDGEMIEGALEKINTLKKAGKRVCFLTNNSSRSKKQYLVKLNAMGIKVEDDDVYTSGNATVEYLKSNFAGKSVYLMGTAALKEEFLLDNINLCNDETADVLVISFDTELTYDKLYTAAKLIKKGVPYIATHPDFVCPAKVCDMPDIGSYIELFASAYNRRPDAICGKPDTIMGQCVAKKFNLKPNQIAMVGDRLYTDVRFAINNGFYGILVLSGETTLNDYQNWDAKTDLVLDSLAKLEGY